MSDSRDGAASSFACAVFVLPFDLPLFGVMEVSPAYGRALVGSRDLQLGSAASMARDRRPAEEPVKHQAGLESSVSAAQGVAGLRILRAPPGILLSDGGGMRLGSVDTACPDLSPCVGNGGGRDRERPAAVTTHPGFVTVRAATLG